jgi:hypothetical protein
MGQIIIMVKNLTKDEISAEKFIQLLQTEKILVFEDVQGSKIWANWDGENWNIRQKNLQSDPINMVDLAMQNYYNGAYNYLNNLSDNVKNLINKEWHFCFEYFCDTQPANIEYDKLPKNGLILTCIYKGKKQYSCNVAELAEFATLFSVDPLPVIYSGRLNNKQIEVIASYMKTSPDDVSFVFGEQSFAKYFYNILNPAINNSFLMSSGSFQNNVEKIIIRFTGNNEHEQINFGVLNPLYTRLSETISKTEFAEIYSLLLLNFVQFFQTVNIAAIKIDGSTRHEAYLSLVSKIYNLYIQQCYDDVNSFDFVVPPFFNQDKFKINKALIKNKATLDWINKGIKPEYMLKILLGSLQKPMKKVIGIFTDSTKDYLNKIVSQVQEKLDRHMRQNVELQKKADKMLTFDELFDKIEKDAAGNVYPEIQLELDDDLNMSNKKDLLKGGLDFSDKKILK